MKASHDLEAITTLDDAKREISRLLDIREKAYEFLRVLCIFNIRDPLLLMNGWIELLDTKNLSENSSVIIDGITNSAEKIRKIIDAVGHASIIADGKGERIQLLEKRFPKESVNLNTFISNCIEGVRKNLQEENRIRAESEILFSTNIADNLPVVECNKEILQELFSDLVWFITKGNIRRNSVDILATFDENWVKVRFSCTTNDPYSYLNNLEDFKKFKDSSTFFEFDYSSLFLYNNWHYLKTYDGKLLFTIQDNVGVEKESKIEVTVLLKRHNES